MEFGAEERGGGGGLTGCCDEAEVVGYRGVVDKGVYDHLEGLWEDCEGDD